MASNLQAVTCRGLSRCKRCLLHGSSQAFQIFFAAIRYVVSERPFRAQRLLGRGGHGLEQKRVSKDPSTRWSKIKI